MGFMNNANVLYSELRYNYKNTIGLSRGLSWKVACIFHTIQLNYTIIKIDFSKLSPVCISVRSYWRAAAPAGCWYLQTFK